MDYNMCDGCRTLYRTSRIFVVLVILLVFTSVKVSSVKLMEQRCKPRPAVVEVEEQGHTPYHIELYRCSGTCDENIPPSQKPCLVKDRQEISLEVTDFSSKKTKTIKVYNHTSCHCKCNIKCQMEKGQIHDPENCVCISGPMTDERRDEKTTGDCLNHTIGMATMGFVTLIVLVFELIMCTKRKEVLERVKKSCCKRDEHVDGKEPKSNNSLNTAV